MKVAILGTGNIGTDLLIKVLRSEHLECAIFAGRNYKSAGMQKAKSLDVPCSDRGIEFLLNNKDQFDLIFDATSAKSHLENLVFFNKIGKKIIDLTPSNNGKMCVPSINLKESLEHTESNLITCGGQASLPIAHAISQTHDDIEYLEVVVSGSSKAAGPATRANVDEYIGTTEKALQYFTGIKKVKTLLILNPADPGVDMQITISAKVKNYNAEKLNSLLERLIKELQSYVPGYKIEIGPIWEGNRIVIIVKVKGVGDYLPEYAGNLDIINCAAIMIAEEYAKEIEGNVRKYHYK